VKNPARHVKPAIYHYGLSVLYQHQNRQEQATAERNTALKMDPDIVLDARINAAIGL